MTEDFCPLAPGCIIKWSNNQSSIVGYNGEIYVSTETTMQNMVGEVSQHHSTCYVTFESSQSDWFQNKSTLICKSRLLENIHIPS